jgi:hypothetical protein
MPSLQEELFTLISSWDQLEYNCEIVHLDAVTIKQSLKSRGVRPASGRGRRLEVSRPEMFAQRSYSSRIVLSAAAWYWYRAAMVGRRRLTPPRRASHYFHQS